MSKIEWTDLTFNPVWGCNSKECDYCYARGIAKRFASEIARKELDAKHIYDIEHRELTGEDIANNIADFVPTFLQSNYDNFKPPKTPKKIFVGSMSDIAFWTDKWIKKLIFKIKEYPQHTFQLLTKFPKTYQRAVFSMMPNNVWFGVTVTTQKDLDKSLELLHIPQKHKRFISFEPLKEYIPTKTLFGAGVTDWIIIGAMSGRNKPRTKTEWIGAIVSKAKEYNLPVFVKQLEINGKLEKDINKFPENLRLRQFPS